MFKKFMSHAWFSPRGSPGGLFPIRDMFTRHDITTSKNKYFLFLYCPSSSEWSDVSKNVIKNGFTQQQHVQNLCVPCMIFFFFRGVSGGFPGAPRIYRKFSPVNPGSYFRDPKNDPEASLLTIIAPVCTRCTCNMLATTFVSHTQPWKTPQHRQNREKQENHVVSLSHREF